MEPSKRRTLLLLAGYVLLMAVILALMLQARRSTIAALDRPQARAEWEHWKKQETARQQQPGASPVRRTPPRSDEPPGLVLMRDHFGGILAAVWAIATFLYGFCAAIWTARRRAQ